MAAQERTQAIIPEVDRAQWFSPEEARQKILAGQSEFIGRLIARLGMGGG